MKNSFSKALSIILALCMVISICAVPVFAGSSTTTVYYVQAGAAETGDGRSADAPAASLATVIDNINTDGHAAGDNVTVYIMRAKDEILTYTQDDIDAGKVKFIGYNQAKEHTATITYKSYDSENRSTLLLKEGYAMSGTSHSTHMQLKGPSVFEGINITDTRADSSSFNIYTMGHDARFDDVDFFRIKLTAATDTTPASITLNNTSWNSHFQLGGYNNTTPYAGGGTVIIEENLNDIQNLRLSGTIAANQSLSVKAATFNNDSTVKIGNGTAQTLKSIVGDATGADTLYTTYKKNLNIVANNVTVSKFTNSKSTGAVINGALQIILNNGSTVPELPAFYKDAAKTTAADIYKITVAEGMYFDVTSTAGTYTVAGEGIAYVVSKDGKTVSYSNNGTITIPDAGTYTVKVAASVDDIVAGLDTPATTTDYKFDGWDTSVAGKITAKFVPVAAAGTPTYYVKWGGTGDGLSPEKPVATVKDAITLINAAGYDADDKVVIYIMNDDSLTAEDYTTVDGVTYSDFWWYDADGNFVKDKVLKGTKTYGRLTAWSELGGSAGTYTATLEITGYGEGAYLFQSQILGYNATVTLGGPTIFKNLGYVTTRYCDRELFVNGYDVTFNNVTFHHLRGDNSADGNAYDGIYDAHLRVSLSGAGTTCAGGGGTVTFNSAIPAESDTRYGLVIPGNKSNTFSKHTKIYLNGDSTNGQIAFGQASGTFSKGLSIVVNNGTYKKTERATEALTINGGLQIVTNNGTSFPEIPTFVTADKTWKMSSADTTGCGLDVTDTAGTFTVIGGKTAWAENADGYKYASSDGVLTVPAGTYTVTYKDAVSDMGVLYLDGEKYCEFVPGAIVALPTLSDKPGIKFVGWGKEGDLFSDVYQSETTDTEVRLSSQFEVLDNTVIFYVDQTNGNDENNGATAATAFASINAAITAADQKTEINKLIVIIGQFEISGNSGLKNSTLTSHTSMITITGDGSGNSSIRKLDTITNNGPLTIENITIVNAVNHKQIDTSGKQFVVGKNVVFTREGSFSASFDIHSGAYNSSNGARENVTINSPVGTLWVGSYYNNAQRTFPGGDYNINSTVTTFNITPDGWASGTNIFNLPCEYNGAININLNEGGKIVTLAATNNSILSEKTAVHVFDFGGTIGTTNALILPYVWNIDTTNFTQTEYITGGENAGEFIVFGGKTALATHSDGGQFVSTDGVLNLTKAGDYTVEFVDQVYYTNSGTRIDFYQDMELDVTTVEHDDIDGKLFIGWTYENGDVPATTNFKEGDVLVAKYVELSLDENFYIEGAQIRTSGEPGLRFVIRKSDAMETLIPNIQSFGSVVLPSYVLHDYTNHLELELELDKEYTYNSKKYTSAEVEAVKLYKDHGDSVSYTVVMANMIEDYYDRMYTVRGYIRYKDLNGIDGIIYTDYYATRHVNVAEAILRDTSVNLTAEQTAYYQDIIDTVKTKIAAKFAGEQVTIGGSKDDPISFKHVYSITGNGLEVREVNVYPSDYVEGKRDPVVIMQASDIHFNYTSPADFKEANPSIMSTYKGRTWLAGGKSLPQAMNTLEYCYTGDAMVITGDTVDFLSLGSLELTNKYVFDVYPFAVAALGNHEGTRVCQQPADAKAPDPTTLESRLQVLQDNWNGESVYYSSRVVGDRVMLIQMDNGTASKFWDVQVEPFEADLALAREKGYTVLLFFHIPLATGNPNEKEVDQLPNANGHSDNSGKRNFMTEGIKETANAATTSIFGLIRDYSDVIEGMFTGHTHSPYYSEFVVSMEESTVNGETVYNVTDFVPQYTMTATAYGNGAATKITVY